MEPVFCAAELLLPGAEADLGRWACLACDQFTSDPAYWQAVAALVGDAPSTLRIVLPEVYLEENNTKRIQAIHAAMASYAHTVLTRRLEGFMYVERETASGVRPGVVGAVDLEQYSYEAGTAALIRPSEHTVTARIPPRLAVRRGAVLETPHILMLLDDPADTVLGPLTSKMPCQPPLYDTALPMGGGRVRGWAVTDPVDTARLETAVMALADPAAFAARWPGAPGASPMCLAVGDGNHSLATAKAYWEELKPTLSPARQKTHPARFCLVEVENIHCPAIRVEPIHRAVFGADAAAFGADFAAFLQKNGALGGGQAFRLALPDGGQRLLTASDAVHPLAVGTLEAFLAAWQPTHPQARVDYIHGEDAVRQLAAQGAVGVLLPPFAKSDLFRGVVLGGVLPKKTFSMGSAREKRYYLECRKISL